MDASSRIDRAHYALAVQPVTLSAYTGPAGVGKTYHLMRAQGDALEQAPLSEGQRVLALTFMHGSRRRLDDKLKAVPGLRGRYRCMTVDRYAWELCTRWRSLRRAQSLPELTEEQYEQTCDSAGSLLERGEVRLWVARTYPHIVVDEAQDLTPQRLRILRALEPCVSMIVAADEFQCLTPNLQPNPAVEWLQERCEPTILDLQRRTDQAALMAAAHAVRDGANVVGSPPSFVVAAAPGAAPYSLAATYLANAIAWHGRDDIAVITPSKAGGFANGVVERVRFSPCGQQQNGPYDIRWELSDDENMVAHAANLNLPLDGAMAPTLEALAAAGRHPAMLMCRDWVQRSYRLTGRTIFQPVAVQERLVACFTQHRRYARPDRARLRAMTVHQAKNQEFGGVVVLWPYTVAGTSEQKRRLLYNAITRAKRWCTVIVQNANLLNRPPFVPDV
jgi:hypothetical protein